MNFDLGEREKALREDIEGLFDSATRATLGQLEQGRVEDIRSTTLPILRALGKTSYLSLGIDDGKNSVALTLAQETLASISPSIYLSAEVGARLFGRLVSLHGSLDQKSEMLTSLREGRLMGTIAISEETTSIDNNPLNTIAIPNHDGFLASGKKGHVVNAPIADWIAVAGKIARKDEDRIAFFLIQNGIEGLSIGEKLETLGYKGATASDVTLEDCPIQAGHVIGPLEGKRALREVRSWEDQILTAASLGLMKRTFDVASDYAKTHVSGGKPIISYQEIGFKLAEMLTLLQTAQLLAYRAAWMSESGDREAAILTHCAKVFCAESAEEVASSALQILGGDGYFQNNPAEEGYRDAKYLQIAGTSSEISRIKIADGLLY